MYIRAGLIILIVLVLLITISSKTLFLIALVLGVPAMLYLAFGGREPLLDFSSAKRFFNR